MFFSNLIATCGFLVVDHSLVLIYFLSKCLEQIFKQMYFFITLRWNLLLSRFLMGNLYTSWTCPSLYSRDWVQTYLWDMHMHDKENYKHEHTIKVVRMSGIYVDQRWSASRGWLVSRLLFPHRVASVVCHGASSGCWRAGRQIAETWFPEGSLAARHCVQLLGK